MARYTIIHGNEVTSSAIYVYDDVKKAIDQIVDFHVDDWYVSDGMAVYYNKPVVSVLIDGVPALGYLCNDISDDKRDEHAKFESLLEDALLEAKNQIVKSKEDYEADLKLEEERAEYERLKLKFG